MVSCKFLARFSLQALSLGEPRACYILTAFEVAFVAGCWHAACEGVHSAWNDLLVVYADLKCDASVVARSSSRMQQNLHPLKEKRKRKTIQAFVVPLHVQCGQTQPQSRNPALIGGGVVHQLTSDYDAEIELS